MSSEHFEARSPEPEDTSSMGGSEPMSSSPGQPAEWAASGELRTSSYVIYVEMPEDREQVLLVHGYSGAYDKVSRKVALYLRSLEAAAPPGPLYGTWTPELELGQEPVIRPSEQTLETLKRRGYLTNKTVDEERAFFEKFANRLHQQSVDTMPGYIIMPTYQCNLRCPYCFQDHMRTNPAYKHLLRTMQPAMVDRILRSLPRLEAGHGVPEGSSFTRSFTFFGGEPLLEESRPVVEYFITKALELGKASFSAITNATDLHAYADLLGPERIAYVQITLDGPPREHDRRRIYESGAGTFERIARNIDLALDRQVKVSIRLNVDRRNLEDLPELAEEMHRRGWVGRKGFSVYAAPVHAANAQTPAETTFGSWELNQGLAQLRASHPPSRLIESTDDGLRDRVRRIFDQQSSPMPFFRSSFCSAHNRMYIFDAFGDIYACWERTGDAKMRIGRVDESGEPVLDRALTQTWRTRNVASNPVCRKCRYALYCGGGCAVLAEGQNGTMHSNFCDSFGRRFRVTAAAAYQEHASGAEAGPVGDRVCDL